MTSNETPEPEINHPVPSRRVSGLPYLTGTEAMRQLAERLQKYREDENKRLYFLTVTYTFKRGEERTAKSINRSLERVHRLLLEHLAGSRNYHRQWFRSIEPFLYVFVDAPNSKQKSTKKPIHIGSRDSTLHHHVIIVADAIHEGEFDYLVTSKEPVAALFGIGKDTFGVREMKFQRVDPGAAHVAKVMNYASSWAAKHYSSDLWDDYFLVLPRAQSERRSRKCIRSHRKDNTPGKRTPVTINRVEAAVKKERREIKLLKSRLEVIQREQFDRECLRETGWHHSTRADPAVTSRAALIRSLKKIDPPADDTPSQQEETA